MRGVIGRFFSSFLAAEKNQESNMRQSAGNRQKREEEEKKNRRPEEEHDPEAAGHRPQRGMKLQPLDEIDGFFVRPGFYNRDGATAVSNGVSFTIHSLGATECTLLLFHPQEKEPYAKLKFPDSYHIGNTYSMLVFDLRIEEFEYAFQLDEIGRAHV